LFARLNRYARYACAPIAALALWAVLVAVLPAAAAAEQTPRANAQDTAHRPAQYVVVAPGDSLWSISERQLGPSATGAQIAKGVERIYALNRNLIGADPDLILVGQRFALPRSLERLGAKRHASGQVPRQAREAARAEHAGASSARPEAARTVQGAGSDPVRAADRAAGRSAEDFTERTTNVPVAAHTQGASEVGTLPEEAAAPRVPAVRHPNARVTLSSPVSYLGDVHAGVSSAVSTLMDAVVTDDRYAGRQLLGLVLILLSLGIGVFPIIRAAWRAMARHEREKDRRRRVEAAYAAPTAAAPVVGSANPRVRETTRAGTRSVRSEEPGRSEAPVSPTQGESKGGSSPEGPRRNAGRSRSRGRSAVRTKPRRTNRTNRRRKVVGENQEVPDSGREWQIGEGLRHSIGGIPLRPDAMGHVLAELKPRVEKELRSVVLVERRRPLSDREHRQVNALRDLLALAQENRNTERPV
jgi:hypothetical protein